MKTRFLIIFGFILIIGFILIFGVIVVTDISQGCPQFCPKEKSISTVIIPKGAVIEGHDMLIPKVITVVLGINNTVMWINEDDTAHGFSSDNGIDGGWGTGLLKPGESSSVTFNHTGIFEYHGEPHPWGIGKVIVLEN